MSTQRYRNTIRLNVDTNPSPSSLLLPWTLQQLLFLNFDQGNTLMANWPLFIQPVSLRAPMKLSSEQTALLCVPVHWLGTKLEAIQSQLVLKLTRDDRRLLCRFWINRTWEDVLDCAIQPSPTLVSLSLVIRGMPETINRCLFSLF